jgi:hypothetical protein
MTTIADFRAFFDRCRHWEKNYAEQSATQLLAGFLAFFPRVGPKMDELIEAVRSEQEKEAKQHAPRFNVFRVVEIERKEEILHTRMLAHLLDPSAHHGQGLLFLKSFFDAARSCEGFILPAGPIEEGRWFVQKEFPIAGVGELDLLIENTRKKYIIVIENKIDDKDHPGQLSKYRTWMDKARAGYDCRQLVYLTPDGSLPIFGMGCNCRRLSYKREIRAFLNAALQQVRAAPTKEIVRQYLAVVNDLTEYHDEQRG